MQMYAVTAHTLLVTFASVTLNILHSEAEMKARSYKYTDYKRCVLSVLTLEHGGSVLVPCYPSGVTYNLFKYLSMLCVVSADAEAWRECAGTVLPVWCDVRSV